MGMDGSDCTELLVSDRSLSAYAIDAEPMGKPGWPELAFCTMSTARKRSVLMHSSSNAGGAMVVESLAEGFMECACLLVVEKVEHRTGIRDPRLR
jgi:hypothetical protein